MSKQSKNIRNNKEYRKLPHRNHIAEEYITEPKQSVMGFNNTRWRRKKQHTWRQDNWNLFSQERNKSWR